MLAILLSVAFVAAPQQLEKQLVVTITAADLRGGIVSEITWDGGVLLLQGVFAAPHGDLKAQYFIVPADRITIEQRDAQTDESLKYWRMKSNPRQPDRSLVLLERDGPEPYDGETWSWSPPEMNRIAYVDAKGTSVSPAPRAAGPRAC